MGLVGMNFAGSPIFVVVLQLAVTACLFGQSVPRQVNSNPASGTVPRNSPYQIVDDDFFSDIFRSQLIAEEAAKVPKALKERHKIFLKLPNTGITKLYPSEIANILNVEKNNKRIPGACAFFSFYTKRHQRYFADIRFVNGRLLAGLGSNAFGAMIPLGDVPLESIESDSNETANFMKHAPIRGKVLSGENVPQGSAEIVPTAGVTFLLRSIHIEYHELLIAFRVIERSEDGSITFLWRRLYKGKAPEFKDKE